MIMKAIINTENIVDNEREGQGLLPLPFRSSQASLHFSSIIFTAKCETFMTTMRYLASGASTYNFNEELVNAHMCCVILVASGLPVSPTLTSSWSAASGCFNSTLTANEPIEEFGLCHTTCLTNLF